MAVNCNPEYNLFTTIWELEKWISHELEHGNRIKASKLQKILDKFQARRKSLGGR